MNHPEGLPGDHRELLKHETIQTGFTDLLLSQVLRSFNAHKYVLIVQAECAHGHLHLETHSGGLDPHEVKRALIDTAAAYDPDQVANGPG